MSVKTTKPAVMTLDSFTVSGEKYESKEACENDQGSILDPVEDVLPAIK